MSLRHIKSIERGLSDSTLSTLEKIASALSLRVKELFALEEIRRSPKGIGKDSACTVGKLQRERATSILCLQQDSFVQVQVGYLATKTGRQIALSARLLSYGAEGETRTPMKEPSLDPEPSVSTNSTTSAWKGGIPKTFRAGKRKNALSEEISAKTTLPSVFPPDFGSAPPRNWRCHPLSHGEDAGRADCPPQE